MDFGRDVACPLRRRVVHARTMTNEEREGRMSKRKGDDSEAAGAGPGAGTVGGGEVGGTPPTPAIPATSTTMPIAPAVERRLFYIGASDAIARELASVLEGQVQRRFPSVAQQGDTVVLDTAVSASGADELPAGNAFTACRRLKEGPGVRVFLLVEQGDRLTPEIARFCLADGCLEVVDGHLAQPRELLGVTLGGRRRRRPAVDELLARLERELDSDRGRHMSAIQKMLSPEQHDHVLQHLTDPETGLYDGPYAGFKLDEEFKRSTRFHQPLSLILLDMGMAENALPEDALQRRTLLAEVASVFLNECRDIDVLGRFTVTTFLCLLPGTGTDGALVVARRILDNLCAREFVGGRRLAPSAGIVTVPATGIHRREAFLARAEACLRLAQEGRGEDGLCASWE